MDSDEEALNTLEIRRATNDVQLNLLPQKSRKLYEETYRRFMDYHKEKTVWSFSENVLIAYFAELSKKMKSSSLYSIYSMLKATLLANNNLDISKYSKLRAFLKRQSDGYQPKTSEVLKKEQIDKFILEAPDHKYLTIKVALMVGVAGACRREELVHIKVDDIDDIGSKLLITLPDTKTKKSRSFVVTEHLDTFRKYAALRPLDLTDRRFFFKYSNGKACKQVIGINKFGGMPQEIASYLNLPNIKGYTGHCFRRTSAMLSRTQGLISEGILYYIVEFPLEINNDSAPTAIISSTWTFKDNGETFCWWPKFKSDEQRKKAVIQHRLMDIENCTPREISIKYRTDIYRKAIHKLKQLEEFSDVQTDDDGRQEKGRNTAYDDITSDASSDGSLGPLITPNAKRNKKNTLEDDRVTPQKLDPVVSVSTSPCSSCKTVERLCTNLITLVEKNGQKIENLTEIVNAVLQTKDQQPLTAEENVQLPLKSPSDMDNFEQLLTDKNEFTKKLNFLRFVGGKDIVDTTRRVIGRILSHDLALKINWSGRNDKPSFQKYKTILSLISAAVHCNPLANEASEKEIFDIIKIWLRGAIDREGGRIKRKRDNVT